MGRGLGETWGDESGDHGQTAPPGEPRWVWGGHQVLLPSRSLPCSGHSLTRAARLDRRHPERKTCRTWTPGKPWRSHSAQLSGEGRPGQWCPQGSRGAEGACDASAHTSPLEERRLPQAAHPLDKGRRHPARLTSGATSQHQHCLHTNPTQHMAGVRGSSRKCRAQAQLAVTISFVQNKQPGPRDFLSRPTPRAASNSHPLGFHPG